MSFGCSVKCLPIINSDITLILHCSQLIFNLLVLKLMENNGPEGLRSLGSPVMSRLLYQAELRALSKVIYSQVQNVMRLTVFVITTIKQQILCRDRLIRDFNQTV